MKKITLLLSLMLSTLSFSQIVTNGNFQTGTAAPWYGNAANVVDLGGSNFVNRAQVLAAGNAFDVNLSQIVNLTSGLTYQLSYVAYTDLTTGTRTMIAGLGQSASPWTAITATATLTSTPQTFTHQFTINYGEAVTDRVIFDMGAAIGFVFIDDVVVVAVTNTCNNGVQDGTETGIDCGGFCPPCVASPTSPAPTPPNRPVADVKSIYSNSYTPLTTFSYTGDLNSCNTSWCPGNTTEFLIGGDPATASNKITGLGSGLVAGNAGTSPPYIGSDLVGGCEGINFRAGSFDATSFTFFHIDLWTPIVTMALRNISLKLSNHNASNTEINAIEYNATNGTPAPNQLPSTNPNPGTWLSFDIPLSSFTIAGGGSAARNNLAEFIISTNLGTVYYDNAYFHKGTTLGLSSFEAPEVKMYPNPASDRLTIESSIEMQTIEVSNLLGQEIMKVSPGATVSTIDVSSLQSGVYLVKTTAEGITSTKRFIKK